MRVDLLKRRSEIEAFCRQRSPQSLDNFLARCKLSDNAVAEKLASAFRTEVSARVGVAPEFIHAEDRVIEDLGDPFDWDSLDVVEFGMELEQTLDVSIPPTAWHRWFGRRGLTVGQVVTGIYAELQPPAPQRSK